MVIVMNVSIPGAQLVRDEYFRENVLTIIDAKNKFLDHEYIENIFNEPVFCGSFWLNGVDYYNDHGFHDHGFRYTLYDKSIKTFYMLGYNPVCPIIKYSDVKDNCKIIEDNEDNMFVNFGKFPVDFVNNSDELFNVLNSVKSGGLKKTGEEVTIKIDNVGNRTKLHIYKDTSNGKEYVFMSNGGEFSDSPDNITSYMIREGKARIGKVEPMKWIVDKESGFMMSASPMFISQGFEEFDKSALKEYLNGDFLKELGVGQVRDQKKNDSKLKYIY